MVQNEINSHKIDKSYNKIELSVTRQIKSDKIELKDIKYNTVLKLNKINVCGAYLFS